MSDFQYITYKEQEGTALIMINRPEVYNALNRDAKFEVIGAIRQAGRSENIRSIILTGEGKAFCTGQDLNDRTIQAGERAVDLGMTLETEWNPLINSIRESKKIVIAAINGVCAGAGLSVAMACDLIVARPEIKFVSGFSKLGLAPDAGSSFTFSRALGRHKTLEFFLFNNPLFSEDLERAGLINCVEANYLEKAQSLAAQINKMPPLSVEMIKKNISIAQEESFNQSIQRETFTQRFLGNSQDYQEGLKAFFEKREPKFQGK